jgi:hypothetical protein
MGGRRAVIAFSVDRPPSRATSAPSASPRNWSRSMTRGFRRHHTQILLVLRLNGARIVATLVGLRSATLGAVNVRVKLVPGPLSSISRRCPKPFIAP